MDTRLRSTSLTSRIKILAVAVAIGVLVPAVIYACGNPDIKVEKTASSDTVNAGGTITYTVKVSQVGNSGEAKNLKMIDTFPAGLVFTGYTAEVQAVPGQGQEGGGNSVPSCTVAGNVITCPISNDITDNMGNGNLVVVFTFTFTVPQSGLCGDITNSATITMNETDINFSNNNPTKVVTIQCNTDLKLEKTGPATVDIGGQITYTVRVTNLGPGAQSSFSVSDTLPAGTTFVSASDGGTQSNGVVTWSIPGGLPVNGIKDLTVTVQAPSSPTECGKTLHNVARIAATTTPDSNGSNNEASFDTTIEGCEPSLIAEKTGPATVHPGDIVTYTVTATNTGNAPAENVVISEQLTDGNSHEFVQPIPAGCSLNPANNIAQGELACPVGDIPDGEFRSVNFTVKIKNTASGICGQLLRDTANVGATGGVDAFDEFFSQVLCDNADIEVKKEGPATVNLGGNISYTVTVKNLGPNAATNVAVMDIMPLGVTNVAVSDPACSVGVGNPTVINCSYTTLAVNEVKTITVTAKAPTAASECDTTMLNIAKLAASTTVDTNGNNNISQVQTVIDCANVPKIKVLKNGPASVQPNQQISYTLTAMNIGSVTAPGVEIVDFYPAQLTPVDPLPAGCTKETVPQPHIKCSVGTLSVSESKNFTLTYTVSASAACGSTFQNQASIQAPQSIALHNPAVVTTTVDCPTPQADIEVKKVADKTTVDAGGLITYTVSVKNLGPNVATNVVVMDILPPSIGAVSILPADGACTVLNGIVTCTYPSLAVNEVKNITISVVVPATQGICGTTLSNMAKLFSSTSQDTNANNNIQSAQTQIVCAPSITAEKTGPAVAHPGDIVTYTVKATNTGGATAQNVVISEQLTDSVTAEFVQPIPAGCSINPANGNPQGELACPVGDLLPGESKSVNFVVKIKNTAACGTLFRDTANVGATGGLDAFDDFFTQIECQPTLRIVKSAPEKVNVSLGPIDNPQEQIPGGNSFGVIVYRIAVTNDGPGEATNVVVTDTVPAGLTFLPESSSAGCTVASGVVSCGPINLAQGATREFTIAVRFPAITAGQACPGVVTNKASVKGSNTVVVESNTVTTTPICDVRQFPPGEKMNIQKFGPTTVAKGSTMTYTINVLNWSSTPKTVTFIDPVPAWLTLDAAQSTAGCTATATMVTCTPFTMGPMTTKNIKLVFKVGLDAQCGGKIYNIAGATGTAGSSLFVIGSNTVATNITCNNTVPQCADGVDNDGDGKIDLVDLGCSDSQDNDESDDAKTDIVVNKTGPVSAVKGNTFQYLFAVTNVSTTTAAANVTLTDALPAGLTFQSVSDNVCSYAGATLSCNFGTLAPQETRIFTMTVLVAQSAVCGGTVQNKATVATTTPEHNTGNNQSATITTTTTCVLAQTQCNDGQDNDGDGKIDLADPGCTDANDNDETNSSSTQCLDGIDNDGDGAIDYPNDFSCDSVNDNDEGNPKAQCQDGLDNDGDGLSDFPADPGCVSKQDNNEDNVSSQTQADLSIVKAAPPQINKGSTILYTLTVTNHGPGTATNVTVQDVIPAGLTFNAASSDAICSQNGNTVLCNNFTLSANQNRTIVVAFNVSSALACQGVTLQNQATVATSATDTNTSNNTSAVVSTAVTCPTVVQCLDGIDNDGDGAVDFPNDFSCSSVTDDDETNPKAACQDGIDNDSDGLTDFPQDPGCVSKQDNDEFNLNSCQGLSLHATSVIASQTTPASDYDAASPNGNAADVLGPPNGQIVDFEEQNGQPGRVTVRFDVTIFDGPGNDFAVNVRDFTTTRADGTPLIEDNIEAFDVYASADGVNFVFLTRQNSSNPIPHQDVALGFDLAGKLSSARFVRIVNSQINVGSFFEGVDIDAFTVLNARCDVASLPQCSDNLDNDGDGLTDFPSDTGCSSTQDNDEFNSTGGVPVCSAQDPRIQILTQLYGVQPKFTPSGKGGTIVYWDVNRPGKQTIFQQIQQQGLTPLRPDNYTDAALENLVKSFTNDYRFVAIEGSCNQSQLLSYHNNGHRLSKDRDCNAPIGAELQHKVNYFVITSNAGTVLPDVAFGGTVTLGAAGERIDGPGDGGDHGYVAAICNPPAAVPQCRDGLDNDGDGATDFPNDFSCSNPDDNDETNPKSQCQDGIDNDLDGLIDFPQDPGCLSKQDNDETNGTTSSLTLEKSAPNKVNIPGKIDNSTIGSGFATIVYRLTVRNTGTSTAQNVIVTDPVPAGLTFLPQGSSAECAQTGGNVVCGPITLAPGASREFIVTVRFPNFNFTDACPASVVTNTATVTASGMSAVASNTVSTQTVCDRFGFKNKLAISKSTPIGSITPGNKIRYKVSLTNNSGTPLSVTVTDPVPAWLTFDPLTSSPECTGSTTMVTCQFQLATAGTKELELGFIVNSDARCGGTIYNMAAALGIGGHVPYIQESELRENQISCGGASSSTSTQSDLSIVKSGVSQIQAGGAILYTISVTNHGPATATNIVVTDTIPVAGMTFLSNASSPGCSLNGTAVTCAIPSLASGQTGTVGIAFQISAQACNYSIQNKATVTSASFDPNTANNQSQTVTTAVQCPGGSSSSSSSSSSAGAQIDIEKTGPATATAGGNVTYTFTVKNNGSSAVSNVQVQDFFITSAGQKLSTLPFSFVSASINGCSVQADQTGQQVTCNLGTLQAGELRTFTMTFATPANQFCGQTVMNQVDVTFANQLLVDWDKHMVQMNCGGSSSSSSSSSSAAFTITKTDNRSTVAPGETLTYTVTVTNTSATTVTNVSVVDSLPFGVNPVSVSDNGQIALPQGNIGGFISWGGLTFTPGQTRTFTVVVTVNQGLSNGTVLTNLATVQNFQAQDTTVVQTGTQANFSITKTDNKTTATPGETLNYTITVTNTSGVNATNVSVTDTLPSDVTYISASDNGIRSGNIVTWTIADLAAGQSKTLTLQVQVNSGVTNGAVLTNTATVGVVSAQDTTTVQTSGGNPTFTITKSDGRSTAAPNDTLTYTIVVTNSSTVNATNVTVIDNFPGNVNFLSASDNGIRNGNTVTWTLSSLNAGQSKTLTLQVQIQSSVSNNTTITNYATVNGIQAQDSTTVQTGTSGDNDIDITVRDSKDPVRPDECFEYILTVRNNRSTSTTVDIVGHLDEDTEFEDADRNGDLVGDDRVEWDNISLSGNGSETLRVTVCVDPNADDGQNLRFRGTANGKEDTENTRVIDDGFLPPPPIPPIPPHAAITVDKSADRQEVQPGSVVLYTITIRNDSPVHTGHLTVEDIYQQGTFTVEDAGGGIITGNGLLWEIDGLAPNTVRVIKYRVRVNKSMQHGQTLSNTVTVRGPQVVTDTENVRIIKNLPQTGASNLLTLTASTTLRPRTAHASNSQTSSESQDLPLLVWTQIVAIGMGAGGFFGKKLLIGI